MMRMAGRILSLHLLVLVGIIIIYAGSVEIIDRVKVTGPIYKSIIADKDLTADILPPPEYILESYLIVQLAFDSRDRGEKLQYLDQFNKLRSKFQERHEYWKKELPEGQIKQVLLGDAYQPAALFYSKAVNEYFPALLGNDYHRATILRNSLDASYRQHREQINRLVQLVNDHSRQTELVAAQSLKTSFAFLGILTAFILALSAMIIFYARQSANRLVALNRRLNDIIEFIPDAMFVVDTKGGVVAWNHAMEELTGVTKKQVMAKGEGGYRAALYGEQRPALVDLLDRVNSGSGHAPENIQLRGEKLYAESWVSFSEGGGEICLWGVASPLYDQGGRRAGAIEILRDISERKIAERDLMESQRTLSTLMGNLPGLAYRRCNDDRMTMLFVSDRGLQVTGYHPDELINNRILAYRDLLLTEDVSMVLDQIRQALQERIPWRIEYRIVHRDGSERSVLEQGCGVFDETGTVLMLEGFVTDVTDSKRLEEQLQQAQKMESVGRLAGGVAHDFNNMLSVIIGAADLLKERVEDPISITFIGEIIKAATRSSDITRQLLAFSRKQIVTPVPVNLNDLVLDTKEVLTRLIGEDISLTIKPIADLWSIKIDPAQVAQILMNLSANARDAMPKGGILVLETANVRIRDDYSHYHVDATSGDYVHLAVSDSGIGMDRQTREHVFEPFFTTKKTGQGTGLGMATVYGIVTQNGGFINVYSEPGQGTAFKIYFPRFLEERDATVEPISVPSAFTANATILVVEDEETLLMITTKMLEELGFEVIPIGDPKEAVSFCEQEQRIDLILTDVIMPGMNGKEMVETIKKTRPDLKVLYMSGYSSDIVAVRGLIGSDMHYVQKPLNLEGLLMNVRKALQ